MKFLCDSCKAKYQIADEKVAGKTVRMKCRKCGHQIEVRAAVTETSVANAPPNSPTTHSTQAPPAPRAPQKSGGLATSLSATKPRAPSPSKPPGSALGAAFQRNVSDAPGSVPGQASASIELSVTDEWYVAINGVPVGPVRISELRRKAAAGAVTEESLCWQEGLEEWRPIKSIPDLATLVREAALGNRPSLIAPEPSPQRSPSIPSAPQQARAQRNSAPPPRPLSTPSAPHASVRSNVVPLRPAASMDDLGGFGGNSAATAFAPSPSFAPPPPAPMPMADPFAIPPPPPAPMGAPFAVPAPSYRESGFAPSIAPPAPAAAEKKGVPLWFWPILVVALGFGTGVAFLVFRPQPTPAPVVIQMPATANTTQGTAAPAATDVPPSPTSGDAPADNGKPDSKKPIAVAKGGQARPARGEEEKKGLDLGGLASGMNGPNVGSAGGPSPNAGGGLDSAAVERVVAAHRNGVKRTCWERANQASSANVTVSATVAPNGMVTGTSSSGDDPVVAKCIESQVKTWQFTAPGAQTTVNIPFKFVKQ